MTTVNDDAPGNPVNIKPATWRDLGGLQYLEKLSFPQDAWPLWDIIGILTLPDIVRLKAVINGHMVGFIAVEYKPKEEADWIATIGVLPDFQGRGIGAKLINAGEAYSHAPFIRLCVRASNLTAQRLYTHCGYYHLRTWVHYYHDGEDAIVMEKQRPQPALAGVDATQGADRLRS